MPGGRTVDRLAVVLGRRRRGALAPTDAGVGRDPHEQRFFHRGRVVRGAERRDEREPDAQQLDFVQRVDHRTERTRERARALGPGSFG